MPAVRMQTIAGQVRAVVTTGTQIAEGARVADGLHLDRVALSAAWPVVINLIFLAQLLLYRTACGR